MEVIQIPLNNYQKMCYRWFGRSAESVASEKLKADLKSAHIDIRPGAYISYAWVNTLLVGVVTTVVYLSLVFLLSLDFWGIMFLLFIPVFGTMIVYLYFMAMPASRA